MGIYCFQKYNVHHFFQYGRQKVLILNNDFGCLVLLYSSLGNNSGCATEIIEFRYNIK